MFLCLYSNFPISYFSYLEEVVTFSPNSYWSNQVLQRYHQQYVPYPQYNKPWDDYNYQRPQETAEENGEEDNKEEYNQKDSKESEKREEALSTVNMGGPINTNDVVEHTQSKDGLKDINSRVFSSLKELETDVTGFRDAMGNAAEALIDARYKNPGKLGIMKTSYKRENKRKRVEEALQQTEVRKEKFENQLLHFFTNYICSSDCKKRRKWFSKG